MPQLQELTSYEGQRQHVGITPDRIAIFGMKLFQKQLSTPINLNGMNFKVEISTLSVEHELRPWSFKFLIALLPGLSQTQ